MTNCPICNSELIKEYSYGSEYGTEEYQYSCINCNKYTETFIYGNTEIIIGDFTTGFNYTITKEQLKSLFKKIVKVSELYKEVNPWQITLK